MSAAANPSADETDAEMASLASSENSVSASPDAGNVSASAMAAGDAEGAADGVDVIESADAGDGDGDLVLEGVANAGGVLKGVGETDGVTVGVGDSVGVWLGVVESDTLRFVRHARRSELHVRFSSHRVAPSSDVHAGPGAASSGHGEPSGTPHVLGVRTVAGSDASEKVKTACGAHAAVVAP